jgi:hypothetical protein
MIEMRCHQVLASSSLPRFRLKEAGINLSEIAVRLVAIYTVLGASANADGIDWRRHDDRESELSPVPPLRWLGKSLMTLAPFRRPAHPFLTSPSRNRA